MRPVLPDALPASAVPRLTPKVMNRKIGIHVAIARLPPIPAVCTPRPIADTVPPTLFDGIVAGALTVAICMPKPMRMLLSVPTYDGPAADASRYVMTIIDRPHTAQPCREFQPESGRRASIPAT